MIVRRDQPGPLWMARLWRGRRGRRSWGL